MIEKHCNVCGRKSLGGKTAICVTVSSSDSIGLPISEADLKQRIDAMSPYQLDKEYVICFSCWLHSMGVTP